MSGSLTGLRCANHLLREAAARCPECRRYFCRECVTEHDGRMLCTSCLRKSGQQGPRARRRIWPALGRGTACVASLFLLWMVFYVVGRLLLSLPTPFHDGTLWNP